MDSERSSVHVGPARTALLVLGMHRSGTSAFTRVFNLLGADLSKILLAPNPDNRLGFWESRELLILHDAILASAGTTWDDWTRFDPGWYESARAGPFRERLRAYLAQDFGASPLFVIKDPRVCRLVRLWRETCDEIGVDLKVVIPIRNPLEVMRSLERRHGFPAAKCHLMWLRHALDALHDSTGLPRCVVSYAALLRDWRKTVAAISRSLSLTWPRYSPSGEAEIDRFLASEERHHVVDDEAVLGDPALSPWVRRAYRALLTLTGSDDDPSALADLDDLLGQLDAAGSLFDPLLNEPAAAPRAGQRHPLEDQLEQATADLNAARRGLNAARRRLDAATADTRRAEAHANEARQRLAETERRLARWHGHARALSLELTALRGRPALRLLERFRSGPDLSRQIDPAFHDLLDDSYMLLGVVGYRLQPSEDLQALGCRRYPLALDRSNLSGLMLAPIIDLPEESGSLGIELATPEGVPVARAWVPLTKIAPVAPVRFAFAPVASSARPLVLRVDVRDATTPVRLFEWRQRRLGGLGGLRTRPFCAFLFD
jgi:hypothetical protein